MENFANTVAGIILALIVIPTVITAIIFVWSALFAMIGAVFG